MDAACKTLVNDTAVTGCFSIPEPEKKLEGQDSRKLGGRESMGKMILNL